MNATVAEFLYGIAVWALPAIIAITFHEAAHGIAAWRLGDDTAYRLGRVTLNPIRHIDPIGTILLPALLWWTTGFVFGYAKPVPVAFHRLNNPRRDMVLVAAAGPAMNILLAITAAALLVHVAGLVPEVARGWTKVNLDNAIQINLILAMFNLLPLPPLDGGRILVGLLPYRLALPVSRLEPLGFPIIVATIVLLPWLGREIGVPLDFVPRLIIWGASTMLNAISVVVGGG